VNGLPAAPPILRLQHVRLPFPGTPESLDQARQFYGEVLGLAVRPHPPDLPGVVLWFVLGDQELHLFGEPEAVAVNDRSRRHPCFELADAGALAALRTRLDGAGATTFDVDAHIPGRSSYYAMDPFDNTLEFVAFEEGHW
jgi:catechol 2,3-dioxygenase-like lactoylglutathione lyase family enzyme